MKKIITGKQARAKLLEGAELLYNCVSPTLSPRGKNVMIARQYNVPYIMHDGVTAANAVESKDEFVNMAVNTIRQSAQKTVVEVGDATTTTIILAYHLIKNSFDLIEKGKNASLLRQELKDSVSQISEYILKNARPVSSDKEIEHVATVSAGGEELGKLVAKAVKIAGKDGQVTVEESQKLDTTIDHVSGMTLDKGFVDPIFINQVKRPEAILEDPWIIVTKKKITTQVEIEPLLRLLININPDKKFVFFGDFDGVALRILSQLKYDGTMSAIVCPVPGYGPRKDAYIDDICTLTGAIKLDHLIGYNFDTIKSKFTEYSYGIAKSVIADMKSTTIVPMEKDSNTLPKIIDRIEQNKKNIETKIGALRHQIKSEESQYNRELLQERLAKLTTGIAVIKVGTKTDVEMREQVELAKDAIGAVKAAMSEGVVPGGETTLVRASNIIEGKTDGEKIVKMSLLEPFGKLLENAGVDDKEKQILTKKVSSYKSSGYDVISQSYTDMIESGIVDPAKVLRLAIENAVSVAGSVITTDVMIADEYVDPNKFELRRSE